MSSLDNILEFIRLEGISVSEFEKEAGLPNGTLNNYKRRDGDITSDNIDKISKSFQSKMQKRGFTIKDVSPFDKPIYVIVKSNDDFRLAGERQNEDDPTIKQILLIQAKAFTNQSEALKQQSQTMGIIAEIMARQEKRTEKIESNLNSALENQNGGIGILVELLDRDILREAKGNLGKAAEIRSEIVRRIAPALDSKRENDIGAGGGTTSRG